MHVYMCVRVFIVDVNANGVVAGNKGIRVEKRGGTGGGEQPRVNSKYAENARFLC